jgi:ATP-dependent DNA helicase RecG
MTEFELTRLVDSLRAYASELEWFEFKENRYTPEELGEYISALANAACLNDKPHGYLIFGIHDKTHEVVGTTFDPYVEKGQGEQPLQLWLTLRLNPNLGFTIYPLDYLGLRIVIFEISAAVDRPVSFLNKEWVRIGEVKTELRNHPEKAREIWNRRNRLNDWSAEICTPATIGDLEPEAIIQARHEFKKKYPGHATAVDAWDDLTFLNKAKIAVQGRLMNTAILLLGRPESASLIAPAVARISWILKDEKNNEKDYEHFGPPFLMSVDAVFKKVRNLTIRHLPDGTLFPLETTQYDPWVLREALHNCIAHQNYALKGRITVVETPHSVMLTNVGSFLPGSVEKVIQQDSPQEIYRNPFLADAMVHLNMIDTQGGGIKKMFAAQVKRFFPLPDYDLTNQDRVVVTLRGEIIDERYTRMLIARTDLDLWDAILLDKIQKKIPVAKDQFIHLKKAKAVEGRYPNIFVSARVVTKIAEGNLKAEYIKHRGFDDNHYKKLIMEYLQTYQSASRKDLDRLLVEKLPEVLSEAQKKNKIHNLITLLKNEGQIRNSGSFRNSCWVLSDSVKSV